MPSSSTGCALIAGTEVSIKGVCVATAGEVLCGKVLIRVMGETSFSLDGKMGVGLVIAMGRCGKSMYQCPQELGKVPAILVKLTTQE